MSTASSVNPKYRQPGPDVLRKLELSRQEAKKIRTRKMHCPFCGFLLRIVPEGQTDMVFVKCQKCKFEGPLSPAYFRRMKKYQCKMVPVRRRIIR